MYETASANVEQRLTAPVLERPLPRETQQRLLRHGHSPLASAPDVSVAVVHRAGHLRNVPVRDDLLDGPPEWPDPGRSGGNIFRL